LPTYDYHCPKCKSTYEVREGFDAPTAHTCQECGRGTAKRLLTPPRIVFKGSGWYITDSRSKSTATSDTESAPSTNGSPEKSEPAAGGKSEASAAAAAG
jgi:putative FmdB family regulatory protein